MDPIENMKKNIKNLTEPLTKELLINLNTVTLFILIIVLFEIIYIQQVAVLHANQQIIDKETKQLRNECLTFYKEAKSWIGIYDELNESLKVSCYSYHICDYLDISNQGIL